MRPHNIENVAFGEPQTLKPLHLYCLVSHVSPNHCIRNVWRAMSIQAFVIDMFGKPCVPKTIVCVMFGEPWALKQLYLYGLVSHVHKNKCIRNVWWAMEFQIMNLLCLVSHVYPKLCIRNDWRAADPQTIYLQRWVNHMFPNHYIRNVWWAIDHQTIVFVWLGELCSQDHVYT